MDVRLDGKSAIITGGSRGIGKAIATAFAESGAMVTITGRNEETLVEAAAEIGHGCLAKAGHAGREDDIKAVIDATMDQFGSIDILVNNAATNPYAGPMIEVDMPRWNKTFDTNVTGPLRWCQQVWERHMKDNGGAIINIASVGAFNTNPIIGVYDLTKAALVHMSEQLAAELGPNTRVNTIAPGLVKTRFAEALWKGDGEARVSQAYPLKRIGQPEDIAGAALFLASDQSAWISGITVTVDGGGEIAFNNLG